MRGDLFLPLECVTVRSGRVAESGVAGDVGRWFHNVVYVDPTGKERAIVSTPTLGVARNHAFQFAIKRGCTFIDRSEKEPRR